jgi:hypothetical protein
MEPRYRSPRAIGSGTDEIPINTDGTDAPVSDHYAALHVLPSAPPEVVSAAYRALAKSLHPDVSGRDTTAEMARLNEAWAVLGDPPRRAAYDRERAPAPRRNPFDDEPRRADAWSAPRMPWGKHEGEILRDVESGYLAWVLTRASATTHGLALDVRSELERRDVQVAVTARDGARLGDIVSDSGAWDAFMQQKGWR